MVISVSVIVVNVLIKVVHDDVAHVHVLRVLVPRPHESIVQVVRALHLGIKQAERYFTFSGVV